MDLSVARAVFTSALLRSDQPAPEVRRDDAALFTKQLLKTLNICTASDVKTCKDFIIKHITPSTARTSALTKYLLVLSKASAPRDAGTNVDTSRPGDEYEGLHDSVSGRTLHPPSASFRRLHIVYVLHDVLCFLAMRFNDSDHSLIFTCEDATLEVMKSSAQLLAQLAVCVDGKPRNTNSPLEAVRGMVELWTKLAILSAEQSAQLRSKLDEASNATWSDLQQQLMSAEAQAALNEQRRKEEETKWVLPRQHHLPYDAMAPWHELPAANALYQKRMEGYPLRANMLPQGGYHVQNAGQQADPELRRDVEELHREALRCFDKYTDADEVRDVDALGNIVWKDRPTRNYYGFTYEGLARRAAELAESGLDDY